MVEERGKPLLSSLATKGLTVILTGKVGRAVYRLAALKSSRASSGKLPCWGPSLVTGSTYKPPTRGASPKILMSPECCQSWAYR